jgi:hypothetical protein
VDLELELRVRAQAVHSTEAFATEAVPAPPAGPSPPEPKPRAAVGPRGPSRDGSRTRGEARTAYREGEGEAAPIPSRFTAWDVTSGLPYDNREADENAAARRRRDLRGRVKAARVALAIAPGVTDAVGADWRRGAGFLARFGITQAQYRNGVPAAYRTENEPDEWLRSYG